jgi:hypothetical protein
MKITDIIILETRILSVPTYFDMANTISGHRPWLTALRYIRKNIEVAAEDNKTYNVSTNPKLLTSLTKYKTKILNAISQLKDPSELLEYVKILNDVGIHWQELAHYKAELRKTVYDEFVKKLQNAIKNNSVTKFLDTLDRMKNLNLISDTTIMINSLKSKLTDMISNLAKRSIYNANNSLQDLIYNNLEMPPITYFIEQNKQHYLNKLDEISNSNDVWSLRDGIDLIKDLNKYGIDWTELINLKSKILNNLRGTSTYAMLKKHGISS